MYQTYLQRMDAVLGRQMTHNEALYVQSLLDDLGQYEEKWPQIIRRATSYVESLRQQPETLSGESLFQHMGLDTEQGLVVMELAEALLRIPDRETAEVFIRDKLGHTLEEKIDDTGKPLWLKCSHAGLSLLQHLLVNHPDAAWYHQLIDQVTVKIANPALQQTMGVLGKQFIISENIEQALATSTDLMQKGYSLSFDMLGEGARTETQASAYRDSYCHAIEQVGAAAQTHGVSVKLSALSCRYELRHWPVVQETLLPRLKEILALAKELGVPVTIDAEEMRRLDVSLMLLHELLQDKGLQCNLGLAVQAYHTGAKAVLAYLSEVAEEKKHRIGVRLVKGAYWDTEIKHAQVEGLPYFPVFTEKHHTDVSYLACARLLLEQPYLFPQFATHNALTIASIIEMAGDRDYEFQRLYGMGEQLYDIVREADHVPCRIYAPVGDRKLLLSYLIRRILENGANSSFVHGVHNEEVSLEQLLADPVRKAREANDLEPTVQHPLALFGDRKNSQGIDLGHVQLVSELSDLLMQQQEPLEVRPIISGVECEGRVMAIHSPSDTSHKVGDVHFATTQHCQQALKASSEAFHDWSSTSVDVRAVCLEKLADKFEEEEDFLISLLSSEAGKTVDDAINEVREAVDFCRYYAVSARELMKSPQQLPGPSGEENTLALKGKGVFVCISPWNFPLAIFTGQIVAALVTGNTVIAKPAEQSSLIGYYVIKWLHESGVPASALHYLPGEGGVIGAALLEDTHVTGVVFTGSTETAHLINQQLLMRERTALPTLIAETGGLNAMIVDSSALHEQVIDDVIYSAFGSAGQRCSALRVLYVQDAIADEFIAMLEDAMHSVIVGFPADMSTQVGPLIDAESRQRVSVYIGAMRKSAIKVVQSPLCDEVKQKGHYIAPTFIELEDAESIKEEIFGPVLHVVRFKRSALPELVESINKKGYGLTLGIHSRIEQHIDYIRNHARVGNIYVNRAMTGAVVGVQPFGGEGLSGTGPKAGGPHYLLRFCTERTVSVNTMAIGGNVALLSGGAKDIDE